MKNTTNPCPNERTYYNAVQLSLPLNVGVCIDEDDPVYSFIEAVKEVNLSKYVKPISSNNTN
ncbi:MAG: hypothetical protein J6E46_01695, partial [Faecalicoccus sp.]|nr:hypothetical protein [Faecalicoccus sp.]